MKLIEQLVRCSWVGGGGGKLSIKVVAKRPLLGKGTTSKLPICQSPPAKLFKNNYWTSQPVPMGSILQLARCDKFNIISIALTVLRLLLICLRNC